MASGKERLKSLISENDRQEAEKIISERHGIYEYDYDKEGFVKTDRQYSTARKQGTFVPSSGLQKASRKGTVNTYTNFKSFSERKKEEEEKKKKTDRYSGLQKASIAGDPTLTKEDEERAKNFAKGVGTSIVATIPTLGGTLYQSWRDWQDKINEEGLESALSEMARNMDNPNWTFGKPATANKVGALGYDLYKKSNDYLAKSQEGLSPSEQYFTQLAASGLQFLSTLPASALTASPYPTLAVMGANAAASKANELTAQGKTATEASGRGLLSGAIETATEKIPLDELMSIAKLGGKDMLKQLIKEAGVEGTEEFLSNVLNYTADVASGDENAKFSLKEALLDFSGGAILGGTLGLGASYIGGLGNNISYEAVGKKINTDGALKNVVDAALTNKIGTLSRTMAEEINARIENGEIITDEETGRLYEETMKDLEAEKKEIETINETLQTEPETAIETPESVIEPVESAIETPESVIEPIENVVDNVDNNIMEPTAFQASEQNIPSPEPVVESITDIRPVEQTYTANDILQQTANEMAEENRKGMLQRIERTGGQLGKNGAKALRANFDSSYNFDDYYNGFIRYYEAGTVDLPIERINTLYGNNISSDIKYAAYMAGKNDAAISFNRTLENQKVYTESGVEKNDITNKMTTGEVNLYDSLGKASGNTIRFAKQVFDGRANGSYENGVITIAEDAENPLYVVAKHEITHSFKDTAPVEYKKYSNYVLQTVISNSADTKTSIIERYKNIYSKSGINLTTEEAIDEIAADFTENILTDSKKLQEFIDDNINTKDGRSMLQRFFDAISDFIKKIKKAFNGNRTQMDAASIDKYGATVEQLEKSENLWKEALKSVNKHTSATKVTKNNENIKYSLNPDFSTQIDNWDGKSNVIFNVGTTSDALKNIGIEDRGIIWYGAKISKILEKHHKITRNIIKQVPNILENPVLVMKSQNFDTRIVLMGELMDSDNNPVVAVLELQPTNKGGQLLDLNIIASAYIKDNNHIRFIEKSELIYIDNNRKRTEKWFNAVGLQLPSVAKPFGSIGKVTYNDGNVNIVGVPFKEYISQQDDSIKEYSIKDKKLKFSLKEPIEQTKNLIALHNLTENKLKKTILLGGFPMPSIAVTKADIPHTNFGDITLVMNKSTVDPKANKKNKVYSADAWTPVFPPIEYEVNDKVHSGISRKYYELAKKIGYDAVRPLQKYVNEMERQLSLEGGEQGVINSLKDDTSMMNLYLADSGNELIKPIERTIVERLSDTEIELYDYLIDKLGKDKILELDKMTLGTRKVWRTEHSAELENAYKDYLKDILKFTDDDVSDLFENPNFDKREIFKNVMSAMRYLKNGPEKTRTEYDSAATKEAILKATDKKAYEKWLNDLFKGIEAGTGIYNNKDLFTPSGNRRTFKQTHYPVTLENIVKAMAGQNNGDTKNVSGFYGIKTLRAGTAERFKSIADMHKKEGRLQNLTEEQMQQINDALDARLSDIINKIDDASILGEANSFIRYDNIGNILTEVAESGKYTIDNIKKVFDQYGRTYNINNGLATEIRDLLFDVSQMPVNIFEAKPERIVTFDEVLAAVVPDTTSQEFIDQLNEAGLQVITYEADNAESRINAVNSVENARFSLKNTKDILKENAALKEYNDYLKSQIKVTEEIYIDKKSLEKLTRSLIKEYGANMEQSELYDRLDEFYNYMQKSDTLSWEDIKGKALNIADDIINDATIINDDLYNEYKNLREYIKKTKVKISDVDKNNLPDGYSNFRKNNLKYIKLSDNGTNIESIYQELSDMYPEFFDIEEYSTPAEQAEHIAEVMKRLQPYEENPYNYNTDAAAEWISNDIIERYYDLPETKPTFADKQQKKLDKQKYKDAVRLKKLRESKNQRIEQIKALGRERVQKAVSSERAKKKEALEKLRQRQKNKEVRMSTRRKRSVYVKKIRKHVDNLNKMLINPTEKSNVPEILRKPVSEFLNSFNMETSDRLGEKTLSKLESLKTEYQRIIDGKSDYYIDIDPDIVENMNQVIEAVKKMPNTRIADMSLSDVEALYRATLAIERSVYSYNKLLAGDKRATVSWYGENVIEENYVNKGYKQSANKLKQSIADMINMDMIAPADFFEELGPSMNELWGNIRKGFDKKVKLTKVAIDYMNDLKGKTDIKSWTGKKAKTQTFDLSNGTKIELTPAQMMSLYLLNKQPDAQNHIYAGGIKPAPIVAKDGVTVKIKESFEVVHVTPEDVNKIIEALTPEQKKMADGISKFFTDYTAEWGNEVSLNLYGYKKFGVENYFPIVSDKNYLTEVFAEKSDATLKNMGSTKSRIKGAKNPIILEDAFEVYARQSDRMASYNAFVVPLNDIQKVYNYKASTGSVKETIRKKFGKRANQYFSNIMTDINGGVQYRGGWGLLNDAISKYKQARMGANLRVALQQPTAYMRASAMINPKYMIEAFAKPVKKSIIYEYAPIAQWKDWGFFSMDTGRSLQDIILDKKYMSDYTMWLAGKMDELTWKRIWAAVEFETMAKHKELQPKTKEFYEAVGQRFSEIIDRTQVVDSTLHRAQILRNPDTLVKMSVSFMSEPIKSYNMLRTAYRNAAETKSSDAYKKAAAASVAYISAIVANDVVTGFIDAFRGNSDDEFLSKNLEDMIRKLISGEDKDEDEEDKELSFYERWLYHTIDSIINEPINMFPYFKDISSILQGYTVKRMDMAGLGDLVAATRRATSDKYTLEFKIADVSAKIADLFGIPASSIKREIETISKTIINTKDDPVLDYKVSKVFNTISGNKSKYMNILYDALKKNDKESYDFISKDLIKNGISAQYIESSMQSRWNKDNKDREAVNLSPLEINAGIRIKNEIPSEKKFDINDLSSEQYKKYTEMTEDILYPILQDFKILGIKKYSDKEENSILNAAYSYSEQIALQKASKGKYKIESDWIESAKNSKKDLGLSTAEYIILMNEYSSKTISSEGIRDAYDEGVDPELYLKFKEIANDTESEYEIDSDGDKIVVESRKEKIVDTLYDMGIDEDYDFDVYWALMEAAGYKNPYND